MKDLSYSDYKDFNEIVDNEVTPIIIRQSFFDASKVLFALDYDKYEAELTKYLDDEDILIELIEKYFPSVISRAIFEYKSSNEEPKHKIKLINKIWEALIGILYGFIISEIFEEKIPLNKSRIVPERLCTGVAHYQLLIIEDLYEFTINVENNLVFFKILRFDNLQKFKDLYLDSQAHFLYEEEEDLSQSYEQVENELWVSLCKALKMVRNLWQTNFIKYFNHEIDIFPSCQYFKGYDFDPIVDNVNVNKDFISRHPEFFSSNFVYANFLGKTFLVSPFIHFTNDNNGLSSLCLYKSSSEDHITLVTSNGKIKRIHDENCISIISSVIGHANLTKALITVSENNDLAIRGEFELSVLNRFIEDGKINQALEYMIETLQNAEDRRDTIAIKSRYSQLRKEIINGTINAEEEKREKNRIVKSILTLVETYQK